MIIWSKKNITTKQKKDLLYKKSTYYGEIGHKVDWVKRNKLQKVKTFNLAKVAQGSLRPIKGFKCARSAVLQINNSLSKLKESYNKKVWYLDKAAPIPGVNPKLSVGYRRKNKRLKKAFNAYRMFKNYGPIRSKKTITKFFSSAYYAQLQNSKMYRSAAQRNSRNFLSLIYLDSLYHSSLQKRAFKVKVLYRNSRSMHLLLNGKHVNSNLNMVYSKQFAKIQFQKAGNFSILAGPNNISELIGVKYYFFYLIFN